MVVLDKLVSLIKKLKERIDLLFFGIIAFLLLNMTLNNLPSGLYGDGSEYVLMICSFANHGTPDLLEEDLQLAQADFRNFNKDHISGDIYFTAFDGKQYDYHFWSYSAICLPAYLLLKVFNANPEKCFVLTNTIFYLLMVLALLFNWQNTRKGIFVSVLFLISGISWYLRWSHPEVMSFCLIVIGLLFLNKEKYLLAAFIFSVASFQNPPIAFLLVYEVILILKNVKTQKFLVILKVAFIGSLTFLPSLFYWFNFGKFNLILELGFLDKSLIGLDRFWSMLFDLNQGIIVVTPLVLILVFFFIGNDIFLKRIDKYNLLVVFGLLMIVPCIQQVNWNMGASGVTRYGFWINALFLFYVIHRVLDIRHKQIQKVFLSVILLSQLVLAILTKFTNPFVLDSLKHNTVVMYIFENHSSFYNPDPEIFVERNNQKEGCCATEASIYHDRKTGEMKKVLLQTEALNSFLERNSIKPEKYTLHHIREYTYVNFK